MGEVSIIGLDLAKNVFQAHGAAADGAVVFRRKLSRAQLLKFMAAQRPCVVAMEACASSHHWGRAIGDLGHEVRSTIGEQGDHLVGRLSETGQRLLPLLPVVMVVAAVDAGDALVARRVASFRLVFFAEDMIGAELVEA